MGAVIGVTQALTWQELLHGRANLGLPKTVLGWCIESLSFRLSLGMAIGVMQAGALPTHTGAKRRLLWVLSGWASMQAVTSPLFDHLPHLNPDALDPLDIFVRAGCAGLAFSLAQVPILWSLRVRS